MTEPSDQSKPEKKRAYGHFAFAVAIYIAGVTAFSVWTYAEHHNAEDFSLNPWRIAIIEGLEVLFLLAAALPLIALYHRARTKSTRRMEELNIQLEQDYRKLKERETALEEAIRDLERFNTVAIGRENRIMELKAEVNTLLEELNRKKRYNNTHID